ncbi:hypothetical protein EVAR_62201_1 [Eumeta japonica]|uniref:Uncharacterized protein n=1 Tax=Eumeta variegata TaxID=151549 RepID=A0A4C2A4T9_EUMVA|nr:hypothetical protein EVAR_62201_1 [Eumeta japonica]
MHRCLVILQAWTDTGKRFSNIRRITNRGFCVGRIPRISFIMALSMAFCAYLCQADVITKLSSSRRRDVLSESFSNTLIILQAPSPPSSHFPFIRYSTSNQEAGHKPVTPLALQVSTGVGHHLIYDGLHAYFPLENATKKPST